MKIKLHTKYKKRFFYQRLGAYPSRTTFTYQSPAYLWGGRLATYKAQTSISTTKEIAGFNTYVYNQDTGKLLQMTKTHIKRQ